MSKMLSPNNNDAKYELHVLESLYKIRLKVHIRCAKKSSEITIHKAYTNLHVFIRLSILCSSLTLIFSTGSHTGQNIRDAYDKICSEFDVSVLFAVTDNASNMRKAFQVTLEDETDATVDADEFWEGGISADDVLLASSDTVRLSCFAHTLQLCVSDGIKNMKV